LTTDTGTVAETTKETLVERTYFDFKNLPQQLNPKLRISVQQPITHPFRASGLADNLNPE